MQDPAGGSIAWERMGGQSWSSPPKASISAQQPPLRPRAVARLRATPEPANRAGPGPSVSSAHSMGSRQARPAATS